MVQTEDIPWFGLSIFCDVPIGFVHETNRGLSPIYRFPESLLLKSSVWVRACVCFKLVELDPFNGLFEADFGYIFVCTARLYLNLGL